MSNAHRENLPRVNEIVCFKLDGSLKTLVVAPNLTDLNAPGGGNDDYSKLPKGNLDPTRRVLHLDDECWQRSSGCLRCSSALEYVVRIWRVIARTLKRALYGSHGGFSCRVGG